MEQLQLLMIINFVAYNNNFDYYSISTYIQLVLSKLCKIPRLDTQEGGELGFNIFFL